MTYPTSGQMALTAAALAAVASCPAKLLAQEGAFDEVIVTSSRIEQPKRQIGTAVSSVGFEEIELRGYDELATLLRTQPGVAVSNSGGAGKDTSLRIRGEEHYRTTLIIDGVRTVDPSAPQVSPSFGSLLSTNDLERVEVLRGPQGFLYGADAGGVVNVITKTGAGPLGGRLGLEYGAYDLRKVDAAASGGNERGDFYVSVTDLATDGFNAQTRDTMLRDDDGADNTTLHTKLGLNLGDRLRLQLVARDIDAEADYDGCFSTTTFAVVDDCTVATNQSTYRASAELRGGAYSNVLGVSFVDIARDNFSEGVKAFSSEGKIERVEYTGTFSPNDALTLVYGFDLENDTLVGDADRFSRRQNGYYLEYTGGFGEHLFITAGARYDDNDDFGRHTSSRVSAAYVQDLGDRGSVKYRASLGTGFRAPSLYEISYNEGPFAFPPAAGFVLNEESSEGYDVGVEYENARGLHLEATYFDQKIENEIYFDLSTFAGYLQSPGRSDSKGVELVGAVPLGERFALNANYTHNEAKDSTNEQRLRRPKNIANLGFSYRSPSEKAAFIGSYRLSRDAVDVGGAELDDYGVLDLSASYTLTESLDLYGRIENATDEQYEEVLGFNTAGRSFYAGVRLRF